MVANTDYSWLALFIAGLATVTQAAFSPSGMIPDGNPISKPGLNELVPVGKPYEITWQPTIGAGLDLSLILLRGPSNDVKPLSTIVDSTPNNGHYTWTPSASLEPDTTHYGIQLILSNGTYQYTTQFGISNPGYSGSSSSSKSASASGSATKSSSYGGTSTTTRSSSTTSCTTSTYVHPTPTLPTSYPLGNSTTAHPTGSVSLSHSTTLTPTTSTKVVGGSGSSGSETPAGPTGASSSAPPVASTAAGAVVRAAAALAGAAAVAALAL